MTRAAAVAFPRDKRLRTVSVVCGNDGLPSNAVVEFLDGQTTEVRAIEVQSAIGDRGQYQRFTINFSPALVDVTVEVFIGVARIARRA